MGCSFWKLVRSARRSKVLQPPSLLQSSLGLNGLLPERMRGPQQEAGHDVFLKERHQDEARISAPGMPYVLVLLKWFTVEGLGHVFLGDTTSSPKLLACRSSLKVAKFRGGFERPRAFVSGGCEALCRGRCKLPLGW